MDLLDIYLRTLAACAPDLLVARVADASMPRDVVAIGKCAGPLLDGFARVAGVRDAIVAMPAGYKPPQTKCEIVVGGHPEMTEASFAAGRRMVEFVDAHDDVTFLISGGGSACVEVPLPPHTEREVAELNARLVASDLPIGAINAERKRVSAIKGGRLGGRVRGRRVTLVYSDVSDGAIDDVASGPSSGGILIADNHTLVRTAAELSGGRAAALQIECDVEEAARLLFNHLRPGELLVAGGEPTVPVGDRRPRLSRGGRCSELAVRFALLARGQNVTALFASSDGVDGSSGAAGVLLRGIPSFDEASAREALARSDSARFAAEIGELVMIPPTGNNLRDLFLLART